MHSLNSLKLSNIVLHCFSAFRLPAKSLCTFWNASLLYEFFRLAFRATSHSYYLCKFTLLSYAQAQTLHIIISLAHRKRLMSQILLQDSMVLFGSSEVTRTSSKMYRQANCDVLLISARWKKWGTCLCYLLSVWLQHFCVQCLLHPKCLSWQHHPETFLQAWSQSVGSKTYKWLAMQRVSREINPLCRCEQYISLVHAPPDQLIKFEFDSKVAF